MNTSYKLLAVALSCMLGVAVCAETGEAAKKKKEEKPKEPLPVTVEGDELYFQESSGDLYAKGNALLEQGLEKVTSEFIHGNAKSETVFADEEATLWQPGTRLVGQKIVYNYGDKTGQMENVHGTMNKEIVSGPRVEIYPDHYVIYNASTTRCNAKIPDYRLTAAKVIIWPQKQMIAYDAKVWIKDKVFYATPRYRKSLNPDEQESEMPKVGYNSENGLYLEYYYQYPLDEHFSVGIDILTGTKHAWRSGEDISYHGNGYNVILRQGDYQDTDNRWIKKKPEVEVNFGQKRIQGTAWQYTPKLIAGMWEDGMKRSWHQDYTLYFDRDPISLDKKKTLTLLLGTGYEKIYESYNRSQQNIFRQDATLIKGWNPKLTTWVAFHNRQNEQKVFNYNTDDMSREFDIGFSYQLDRKDRLVYNESHDMINHRLYDRDISIVRDLHCWQMTLTYRAERKQVKVDLALTRF